MADIQITGNKSSMLARVQAANLPKKQEKQILSALPYLTKSEQAQLAGTL